MPSGKSASKMGKRGRTGDEQSPRGGPVLLNKLLPKGIKQNIFRKNKQSQVSQDTKEPTSLPPLVMSDSGSPASCSKNNQRNGSNSSLNQLRSPSLTSYQSSGYGSQPHSARASLQEQSSCVSSPSHSQENTCLPPISGGTPGLSEGEIEVWRKVSLEGSRKMSVEGGRKVSVEGGRKVSLEGGRKVSLEGGRKVSLEGGRKVSLEGGRKVSLEGGRKVSLEGGRKVSLEGGRKVSVESGMESSPVALKRAGTKSSRDEGTGAVKTQRSPGSRTKQRTSIGQSSPKTSQASYQSPMTITSFARKESQPCATKQYREPSHPVLNIIVNSRRYQVSPNGNVREGSPTFARMRRYSVAHKTSLQHRKPSQVVLPPIAGVTGSSTGHSAATASRHSVPNKLSSWVLQTRPLPATEQRGDESNRVHSHPPRTERKPSGENPVATVTHRVPPPTPIVIAENYQTEADSRDDPDRPKSRRKNAVVSAEDKPDVNALLSELAIPQINLISPTPIPNSSHTPSLPQSTCTSPDN